MLCRLLEIDVILMYAKFFFVYTHHISKNKNIFPMTIYHLRW